MLLLTLTNMNKLCCMEEHKMAKHRLLAVVFDVVLAMISLIVLYFWVEILLT